ncbi:MAG: N-methyl-L-tryptophan oxidase [Gemmatimonadales bacterium]
MMAWYYHQSPLSTMFPPAQGLSPRPRLPLSPTASYDVVVAGLGAMGSATAFHLARRGARVLGLDHFAPPHPWGSSHGRSRIIREAYFESPVYVPLVQRAYELWRELEQLSGRAILRQTGGLMFGPRDGIVVPGALESARRHALPHEQLSAGDMHQRFPGIHPPAGMVGVWEPRAGYLVPEAAVEAHLALAAREGAALHPSEPVLGWRASAGSVRVDTALGTYQARRLVLAAGPWMGQLVAELALPLSVERMVLYWFRPAAGLGLFAPERFPVFIGEYAPGRIWYGIPDTGHGVKVALHDHGELADPDDLRREVGPEEVACIRALVRAMLPAADGHLADTAVCMYTNTPDRHFILDTHPGHPEVLIASPCSGHGFKFSSAIGELLADLALHGETPFDLAPFGLRATGP